MKKIIILTAFSLAIAPLQQAMACEFSHQASAVSTVVADSAGGCSGTNCATEPSAGEPTAPGPVAE